MIDAFLEEMIDDKKDKLLAYYNFIIMYIDQINEIDKSLFLNKMKELEYKCSISFFTILGIYLEEYFNSLKNIENIKYPLERLLVNYIKIGKSLNNSNITSTIVILDKIFQKLKLC